MSKLNIAMKTTPIKTHEGAIAKRINPELQLRRLAMACMLWENQFYVDGQTLADQIAEAISNVSGEVAARIAVEARNYMKLRHLPLLIAREMSRNPFQRGFVKNVLAEIIQRPDELAEYLSIYWKDGKQPISAQSKKGLAKAFTKFDEYSLAKYNRNSDIKLKDVLFMSHAKPKDNEQAELWKRLIADELKTPDTWEVALSANDGVSKKDIWTRLISEKKLGALALLRNLRNMKEADVDRGLIIEAIETMKVERVLPFRFIAAAKYAPDLEQYLEGAMFRCLEDHKRFTGSTVLLIDVSGSMDVGISGKSEMTRLDAACALAMLAREICDDVRIFTFSMKLVEIPNRRGFALRDAIVQSQQHSGTYLGSSIEAIYGTGKIKPSTNQYGWREVSFDAQGLSPDRLIVFTDEQSADRVPDPKGLGYMVNVASYKNGVGYGPWNHVDGFSEKIVDYIQTLEDFDD